MIKRRGAVIRYKDIAPQAKESFSAATEDAAHISNISQLNKYNLSFPNYANPCDGFSVLLDGSCVPLPQDLGNENVAFWSKEISGEDGTFQKPVSVEMNSDALHSSTGFTFHFGKGGDYPTKINIFWAKIENEEEIELETQDFFPNSTDFLCEKTVKGFNKVVFTFFSMNAPFIRLKLQALDFGTERYMHSDELMGANIIQEIDPLSTHISINTADFEFSNKENSFLFQAGQEIDTFFNGRLRSVSFVKKSRRKSKTVWSVQTEDYIGKMDSVMFLGGIYEKTLASSVLESIFKTAGVPYSISPSLSLDIVSGYIPVCSCREALMQVAFAVQAAVDTSNSEVVRVFPIDWQVKQKISLDRIKQGQDSTEEETVTEVEVVAHTYAKSQYEIVAYNGEGGDGIMVYFSEPLWGLEIQDGEIVEMGANFAKINAENNCLLKGKKYSHTTIAKTKKNENVLASDAEKIVKVGGATLISPQNLDRTLQVCYNWFTSKNEYSASIWEMLRVINKNAALYGQKKYGGLKYGKSQTVEDAEVVVGDTIEMETEYLGEKKGVVLSQRFSLNGGGTLLKNIVLRG